MNETVSLEANQQIAGLLVTMTDQRAGHYRIAMLLDAEPGAWFDPAFLRQIDSTATPLSVSDGERKVLNLRVPIE